MYETLFANNRMIYFAFSATSTFRHITKLREIIKISYNDNSFYFFLKNNFLHDLNHFFFTETD